MVQLYILLTLFCSFLHGVSAVLCKYGLQHSMDLSSLPMVKKVVFVLTNKPWLLGVFLGIVANVAVVQIQSVIDISIVYPILNLAYVFTLILGYLFLKEALTRNQWLGVIVVTLGTIIILSVEDPVTGGLTDIAALRWVTSFSTALIVTLVIIGRKGIENKGLNYEIIFALCAGVCFGGVETYLKTNTNLIATELGDFSVFSLDSLTAFFTVWPFFILALFGIVGFIALQLAFSRGHVSVTVPLIAGTQRVINMISGYFVFGEHFPFTKTMGFLIIIVGAVIMIAASLKGRESAAVFGKKFT